MTTFLSCKRLVLFAVYLYIADTKPYTLSDYSTHRKTRSLLSYVKAKNSAREKNSVECLRWWEENIICSHLTHKLFVFYQIQERVPTILGEDESLFFRLESHILSTQDHHNTICCLIHISLSVWLPSRSDQKFNQGCSPHLVLEKKETLLIFSQHTTKLKFAQHRKETCLTKSRFGKCDRMAKISLLVKWK